MAIASGDLLVVLFLRGACDGLQLVSPISGEDRKTYEAERPNIQLQLDTLLKLDDRFGLHPAAAPLHELYRGGKLAIVHCAGIPTDSRSHFDAQAMMELGTPGKKTTTTGWLTRLTAGAQGGTAFASAAITGLRPTAFQGDDRVSVVARLGQLQLGGPGKARGAVQASLGLMYAGTGWLEEQSQQALRALSLVGDRAKDEATPGEAEYPKGEIGERLQTLSRMIRRDFGVSVAAVDMGGWDTHKGQGTGLEGRFANLVRDLSGALSAFMKDMAGRKVTVVAMSEFGRRVKENANRGTDHGHGTVMLALGDGINGGKVHGEWRGLGSDALYERADLPVTTDYRCVLSELLGTRLGAGARAGEIFPGYKPEKPLGVFRA